MNSSITQELQRKFKRRRIEYVVLIAVQAFFVGALQQRIRLVPALGLVLCSVGLSWSLTQYRQKRNTLPESNSYRVLVDTLEVLALMLFVSIFSIAALRMNGDVIQFYAHVSVLLLSFFGATLMTEIAWLKMVFPQLNSAQQLNYVVNLRSSILIPVTLLQLKRIFQWK